MLPSDVIRHLAAALIPVATIIGYARSLGEPQLPSYYPAELPAKVSNTEEGELARSVLLERIKAYKESYARLIRTTYYWVLFIGLTVLLLISPADSQLPFLNIQVPAAATRLFVVAVMLYLWIDFGSTLKLLILDRMALWRLVDVIEGPLPADGTIRFDSVRPLLHGSALLDGWFVTFLPDYTLFPHLRGAQLRVNRILNTAIWSVAAGMIGLAHASAFVLLWDVQLLWRNLNVVRWCVPLLEVAVGALIFLCYAYFQVDKHGKWFFVLCSLSAAIGIELAPHLTKLRSTPAPAPVPAGMRTG